MFELEGEQVAQVETYPGDISVRLDFFNPAEELPVMGEDGKAQINEDGSIETREVQLLIGVTAEVLNQNGDVQREINVRREKLMQDQVLTDLAAQIGTHLYGKLAETRIDLNHEQGAAPKSKARRKLHFKNKEMVRERTAKLKRDADRAQQMADEAEAANRDKGKSKKSKG